MQIRLAKDKKSGDVYSFSLGITYKGVRICHMIWLPVVTSFATSKGRSCYNVQYTFEAYLIL